MKAVLQTFLIVGSIIGILPAIVAAFFGVMIRRGHFGSGSLQKRLLIYLPLICIVAFVVGIVWRKNDAASTLAHEDESQISHTDEKNA